MVFRCEECEGRKAGMGSFYATSLKHLKVLLEPIQTALLAAGAFLKDAQALKIADLPALEHSGPKV